MADNDAGVAPADETEDTQPKPKIDPKHWITIFNFIRVLSYATAWDRLLLIVSVAAAVGAGLTMPLMNILFGQLVGVFTGFFKQGSDETTQEFLDAVNVGVLYMVYLFFARLGLTYIANLGFRMTSLRISAAIRLTYLQTLFTLPISMLDMLPPGQTAAIITTTASILQNGISEKMGQFFSSIATVVAGFCIALSYNWMLTLATSTGLVFIAIVYLLSAPPVVRIMGEVQAVEVQAASVSTEAFASWRMLSACGAEGKMMARYASFVDETRHKGFGLAWIVAAQQSLSDTFALAFWYAFMLYSMMAITSPEPLIVVLLCVMVMASSIGQITAPLSAASQAASAGAIFHTIIDAPKTTYGTLKAPEISADGDIVLENVNFVYPTRPDVKILEGLNLCFPAGKVTAIVGPSGSGKSTIVGILERWYEFNGDPVTNQLVLWLRNGLVTVGGHKLSDIDPKWWRNQIGLVQQDNALFNTTIYKNVEHGLIGTEWECEAHHVKAKLVEEACRDAFADEFIVRLPDGYQTAVGESGIKLSGGQRQRLAIARAIIKKPKILILDEATSAIDVRSEQIVQAALDRACRGRTTIVIAHRLGTIKKAHNIVLLRHGKVVQQGTHESLMKEVGGAYHTLATAQQLDMGDGARNDLDSSSYDLGMGEKSAYTDDTDMQEDFDEKAVGQDRRSRRRSRDSWRSLELHDDDSDDDLLDAEESLLRGITRAYRKEYFANMLSKSASFFDAEANSAGALTARLATDPTQLQQLLGTNMAFALVSVFNVVGCVVVGLVFGWKLTIVALCTSTPLIVAAMYYRVRHEMGFEAMNNAVFAESAKFASESIAATRTVSSLTMEAGICGRYENLLRDHIGAAFRKSVFSVMLFSFSDSISLLCMAFVLWYGGHLLARHEYSPFQYMIVYIAVVQGGMSAGQWLSYGPNIANATAAADRILAMREHDEDDVDADSVGSRQLHDVPDEKEFHVEFKNVWINYPTRPGPVLKGLSLQRGQFAAIVGPSGSGKTTIISLLERFYSVETGTIAINAQNILDLDLHTHRSNLSLVSQEPNIFSGSLRANILLGVPNEPSVTDADLHRAARDAGLHDFIASLPEGYETPVGAAGVALSGGQKQRVSIARALIRRPELLLLDEATSSLDSETEREVQAVFDAAKGQRTMITVAHRLATVQNADIIFVMADGQITEKGDHAALIAKRGMYFQMVSPTWQVAPDHLLTSQCQSQALDR
ncbi:ATP-binding cassette sub-family B member 5 [Verticillium alfalfae VaMs.102]|uniref:ATP-binding cassette sub-family B member 5 n=1 Tax=Verticillium alfalfae (strain VaMs.102 / ATCC MYA-4576 / FGSC 10136) TaxID=526221 RepID=C9S8X6_VERA1|nr:ATP-binding cassette sub-family B member 5 [Verticillium alfalfae VaMs.102]EEY14053.1 ATP-binding cassette sub-family B member 5 [Verticillium alfalfae VaMs.102]